MSDLSRFALRKEIPYVDEKGNVHYRQALAWTEMAPDGTIIIDMEKVPLVNSFYPPFEYIEEDYVYEAWVEEMDKF